MAQIIAKQEMEDDDTLLVIGEDKEPNEIKRRASESKGLPVIEIDVI